MPFPLVSSLLAEASAALARIQKWGVATPEKAKRKPVGTDLDARSARPLGYRCVSHSRSSLSAHRKSTSCMNAWHKYLSNFSFHSSRRLLLKGLGCYKQTASRRILIA